MRLLVTISTFKDNTFSNVAGITSQMLEFNTIQEAEIAKSAILKAYSQNVYDVIIVQLD